MREINYWISALGMLLFSIAACAQPPVPGQWRLTFSEDFNGNTVDWSVWQSDEGRLAILSTRWPDNVSVSGGLLHLTVRKEKRGGADWTAASIRARHFHQRYGYWEARFRYAAATGINQSFWLSGNGIEIDVNEGHYPDQVNVNLHQNGQAKGIRHLVTFDPSASFHIYGCYWDEQKVIYYVDGKEVARKDGVKVDGDVFPYLSTAVATWAGPVTDAIDGKSMDVEWIHVYAQAY
jgi:beta-glucanase (GH16 family)